MLLLKWLYLPPACYLNLRDRELLTSHRSLVFKPHTHLPLRDLPAKNSGSKCFVCFFPESIEIRSVSEVDMTALGPDFVS